jgi:hypothetical protein
MNARALGLSAGALCCAGLLTAANRLQWADLAFQVAGVRASAGILGEHELQEIEQMPPQQQAERLLERSVSRYQGALEQIQVRLPAWEGKLKYSSKLQSLVEIAYNSSDLRVRSAALDLTLVSNQVAQDAATVRAYSDLVKTDSQYRPWRLWILALLAHKGVETESTKRLLLEYMHDSNVETRKWAVDSLPMIGSDDVIEPLLNVLGTDPSQEVRERAGCGLAESGMLTRAQRQKAIPGLLELMDNPTLDRTTQTWVFQALKEISGQDFGENRPAWRDWKAKHGSEQLLLEKP